MDYQLQDRVYEDYCCVDDAIEHRRIDVNRAKIACNHFQLKQVEVRPKRPVIHRLVLDPNRLHLDAMELEENFLFEVLGWHDP